MFSYDSCYRDGNWDSRALIMLLALDKLSDERFFLAYFFTAGFLPFCIAMRVLVDWVRILLCPCLQICLLDYKIDIYRQIVSSNHHT